MLRSAQPSQFSTYPSQYIDTPVLAVLSSDNQTYLPSLAMAGLSCRHIEMINTHDTMEVFSMYR